MFYSLLHEIRTLTLAMLKVDEKMPMTTEVEAVNTKKPSPSQGSLPQGRFLGPQCKKINSEMRRSPS